jgi:hypothetical protein
MELQLSVGSVVYKTGPTMAGNREGEEKGKWLGAMITKIRRDGCR